VAGAFTYLVPPELEDRVLVGVRVQVPFGGRSVRAFVLELPERCDVPRKKLRPVRAVLDEEVVLAPDVLALARFAASYYHASLGEVLAAAVPTGVGREPREDLGPMLVRRTEVEGPRRLGKQQRVALEALEGGPRTWAELRGLGVPSGVLRRLEELGLISLGAKPGPSGGEAPLELTEEQRLALRPLLAQIDAGEHVTTLLFGVTGSGKTEVYLQAIAHVLGQGRSAIVLVPEISLTPQTLRRFQARFGDQVAVLHSQQSSGARRAAWRRVQRGEARVVVGPRSAVWAPAHELGLIVVDEEHEATYKQESSPRYNARDLAVVRGQQAGIPVILGSATPSLESWRNAQRSRYRLSRLRSRPGAAALPEVIVVDMAREWADVKSATLLSRVLLRELKAALGRGEQALLFQNRRGFTTYLSCLACGHVLKCAQCDITLTYHRAQQATVCHFCDARRPPPHGPCPSCLGPPLKQRGAGTERVEEIVSGLLPQARIARLDTDVVRGGRSADEVLAAFAAGEADILVGTQMIAKGLDVANVTVVGVISADTSLNLPDVRAAERTFQLVAQVAGRAGRGERSGVTVVQTFVPEHFALKAAANHRFEAFAREELAHRKLLAYPPYARLLRVLVRGPDADAVEAEAEHLAEHLRKARLDPQQVLGILGPVPSPRAFLAGKHRWQLLVKGSHPGLREAIRQLDAIPVRGRLERVLDVDPFHLL
jgi:primosomal protein N' (replication factor Y)